MNRLIEAEYNIWKTSPLREYLNGEFYENCFSDEEKSRIVTCKVKSYSNAKRDAYGEYYFDEIETIDKVYIPNDNLIFGKEITDCYWTRMTITTKDRQHGMMALLRDKDGGRSLKEKNDSRKVAIVDSQNMRSIPGMVDSIQDVRPVIFIKNK